METKDANAYIDVHVFGFRQKADEAWIKRDVLHHPDSVDKVQSLRRIAGRESFPVDRDKREATLLVEQRYKLT